MTNHPSPLLVTGGSGFIAGHCILQLLAAQRPVRATVRSQASAERARSLLAGAGAQHLDLLEFALADLTDDAGWLEAATGVSGILHVASPVVPGAVEDEVIAPARDGVLRVLRAARDAGVGRVVLTSAFHAVGFGHGPVDHLFTEEDWSPPLRGPGMDAYGRSKVLAERAAWEFVGEGRGPDLVTILPTAVVGPVLGGAVSGTNHLLQQMLSGSMPGYPDVAVPFVDVRDVAAAHIAALDTPAAGGQRILVASQESATALHDVARLLRAELGDAARKVPTRRIPSVVVRLAARFRPELRDVVPDLGYVKRVSNARERQLLGITPRSWGTAVLDGARSMIDKGLVD